MISWVFWLVWISAFGVYEGIALWRKRPQDTLSFKVWTIDGKKGLTFSRFMVGAFFFWLFLHMTFGLFTASGTPEWNWFSKP